MHVASIDFPDFYSGLFNNGSDSRNFVECVGKTYPGQNESKTIIHQAARMIWLADRMDECARGRPALQILFYIIAAEAVSKIAAGYDKEGQSKSNVRKFFEEICSDEHRSILSNAFSDGISCINLRKAIDFLYKIRCDVAHRGQYFSYSLREESDRRAVLTPSESGFYIAQITSNQLRRLVLEGSRLGAFKLLPDDSPCKFYLKV